VIESRIVYKNLVTRFEAKIIRAENRFTLPNQADGFMIGQLPFRALGKLPVGKQLPQKRDAAMALPGIMKIWFIQADAWP